MLGALAVAWQVVLGVILHRAEPSPEQHEQPASP
ncbi:hypothetical protein ASALC70_03178 [Alcanivorax sp. ALC70]|nr:hypothetical protein ASALC70_03178 [Alcanivorax sp. ALC70]